MNKAEYLSDLAKKTKFVGGAKEVELDQILVNGKLKLYEQFVLIKQKDGSYQGTKQPFYVKDEGTDDEEVIVTIGQKENIDSSFKEKIQEDLNLIISETIVKIAINSIDEQNKFAIVTAYIYADDKVNTQQYFAAYDSKNKFYFVEYAG